MHQIKIMYKPLNLAHFHQAKPADQLFEKNKMISSIRTLYIKSITLKTPWEGGWSFIVHGINIQCHVESTRG